MFRQIGFIDHRCPQCGKRYGAPLMADENHNVTGDNTPCPDCGGGSATQKQTVTRREELAELSKRLKLKTKNTQ